jgi:orotidine-5'-phosphate decarboxylase
VSRPEIAIAFDVDSLEAALALDDRLGPGEEWAKVGLELFTAAGPEAVSALRERGRRVFLDLKLHDIPNTVERAARQASALGAGLITVHALGGPDMVRAAVRGASEGASPGPRVVAVTILTSLDQYNLPPGLSQPFFADLVAADMTRMALSAGAAGVVCPAVGLAYMRKTVGRTFLAVTPGIRGVGEAAGDQKRTASVVEATAAGADVLVIGRPVTRARDPRVALEVFRAERDGAIEVAGVPAEPAP